MDLSSMLGGAGGVDVGRLATAIQDVFQPQGGVEGLTNQLRVGGLGSAVDSWISTGSNQAVDPEELGQALGPDTVNQLAEKSGIDGSALLPLLAGLLPQIIDFLTPGGQLPREGGVGSMGDLGGVIGSVLGGGGAAGGAGGLGGLAGGLGGMLGGSGAEKAG
jgi:uncharacterized protein YidB (DUF937 family)